MPHYVLKHRKAVCALCSLTLLWLLRVRMELCSDRRTGSRHIDVNGAVYTKPMRSQRGAEARLRGTGAAAGSTEPRLIIGDGACGARLVKTTPCMPWQLVIPTGMCARCSCSWHVYVLCGARRICVTGSVPRGCLSIET